TRPGRLRPRRVTDPESVYRQTTPRSKGVHERAVRVMPGGTTRTTTYFDPYPLYIDRGEGCRIWDVDGIERLDMLGNYTAMILGHSHPDVTEAGPAEAPIARPDSIGTPAWALDQVVVLPFNNADASEALIRRSGSELAAVILEPIIGAGGVIPATVDYLKRLRDVTRELGILLIFDEVISLRVAPGG